MEETVTHRNVSIINAYTFDIVQKGDNTKKLIQQFRGLEEIPKTGSSTHYVGIYDFSVKLRQWKVNNVKETIELVEKTNTNLLYSKLIEELKEFVTEIFVTVWEPEFLPFNYVLLTVTFDKKILDSKDSYGWLRMSLLPIIQYWRLENGLISYRSEFNFPMYYQLFYDSESIKPELIKINNELKSLSKKSLDVKKYVNTCNKLKENFLFKGLDKLHNVISLLQIQDDFFILGNMGQFDSDLFNVFSLEPNTYKYTGTNPFFYGIWDSWPFPRLFLLYVLSVTPHIWVDVYRTKLKEMLKQVNELKNIYRKTEEVNDENSLHPLLSLKHELNLLLSDLDEIKNIMKIFKSYILDNPEIQEKSIVVIPDNEKLKENLVKNKIETTYIHALNEEFESRATNIEDYVHELNKNLKFLQERIEPLQQQLSRKSNSKLTRVMLYLSIIATSFAVIVGIDVVYRWSNS